MPTAYEIAQGIAELGPSGKLLPRAQFVPVTAKLGEPAALPTKPGFYTLTAEQCLGIEIPTYSLNGGITGYQRPFVVSHARETARALLAGREVPTVELSLSSDGTVRATDGQHRTLAHVIAGLPMRAVITKRSEEQQRQLFGDQVKGRRVSRTTLIIAGDTPYDEYVQDALTSDDHPWSRIVGENATSARISAATMHELLTTYVGLRADVSSKALRSPVVSDRFDRKAADELAELVSAFGTKATNPWAFEAYRLRAIARAAARILRRRESTQADRQRWVSHMPTFSFAENAHLRRSIDLSSHLVAHWNKRLPADSPRRVAA